MHRYIYLTRCLLALLLLVPWYLVGIFVGIFDQDAALRALIRCNRLVLKIFGIVISVENENEDVEIAGGCVFVLLNQTSLLDGSIGATVLPFPWRGIVNIEYALIPLFGWAMVIFSWVIVRQWPQQAQRGLRKAERYLREGGNVWVSIEGKRSTDGSLSHYKKGPAVLAINAGARIVPVVHHGADRCLPSGGWRIRPGEVTVKYLRYISAAGLEYEDRDKIVDELRRRAEEELPGAGRPAR